MHLQRAQDRMKKRADKGRMERTFVVGDPVFLKLQPFYQSSVSTRVSQKLAFRFFGPFEVIKQINLVAYELALPHGSAVHRVFHVSQLKPMVLVTEHTPVSPSLPDFDTTLKVPEQILDSRLILDCFDQMGIINLTQLKLYMHAYIWSFKRRQVMIKVSLAAWCAATYPSTRRRGRRQVLSKLDIRQARQ